MNNIIDRLINMSSTKRDSGLDEYTKIEFNK